MAMTGKFCRECGTELVPKELENEGIVPYCPNCGQYRFPQYNVAVIMIVVNELTGEILLIQQYGRPSYILVAGYVTQSKTVGYVQGMVSDSMNLFGIGYITGVLEACPEAKVLQYNANNFGDIAGGATAAKDMITNGADVIYHAAGGTGLGVINACDEEGIWAIGVDTDQSVNAPDHVITSAMKRVDTASQDISKAVKDGAFTAGIHMYDLNNGGVDLAPTRDHIPADVLEKVEAAKAAIIAGEKTVPTSVNDCPAFTLDD